MGDENPICTLGDYSKPSHEGYWNTIELPVGNNMVPLRSDIIRLVQNGCSFHGLRSEDPNQHLKDFLNLQTIDQSASGKLHDRNAKESWVLLEDLALYDNESWNNPRDFTKPVKAVALPQDVPMVPTTLSIAWKIPNKPLLNTHPCVPMKQEEDSGILWKLILIFPDLRVMVPLSNLIEALAIVKNGVPKMLYLIRRSLEVLRKFHWTILGG
ncbi:hypothetical protein Tco_1150450 [Tanacetum coccineum]